MQQLLCEPEDRLGFQASLAVTRPNSTIVQTRRSGLMEVSGSADGAELIKVRKPRLSLDLRCQQ